MNDDKLYSVAMACAEMNAKSKCSSTRSCAECQFNIFNYINDVREASLLKATATTDYYRRAAVFKQAEDTLRAERLAPLLFLGLLVLGITWCCSSVKSCVAPPVPIENPSQPAPTQAENANQSQIAQLFMNEAMRQSNWNSLTYNQKLQYLINNLNNRENIPLIMSVIHEGVYDVNEDGMVNCIDYTIVFRLLYGSNAHIMINVNPRTGMNHMFIRIWFNTSIMDIEPQGTPTRYSMGLVWGTRYNPAHNRDVTSIWAMDPYDR